MSTAIILAAHGSTRPEPLAALQRFRDRALERHPGLPCRLAYTSRHVLGRLADADDGPPNAEQVLDELAGQGVDRVILQSLHVIPGREFHELMDLAEKARASGRFQRVEVGRPLLDSEEDAARAAEALLETAPDHSGPGRAVIFMGHGTHHEGNQAYAMLDAALRRRDPAVLVGTMKGELDLEAVLNRLSERDVRQVHLLPLFFGAGAHAEDDMAGDGSESWENRLKDAGIQCDTTVQGGADWESLADIWLDHLDQAVTRAEASNGRIRASIIDPDSGLRRDLDLAPDPDQPLSRILFLAGVWPDVPLCSGLGRCGLCRVRYLSDPPRATPPELRRLGTEAADQGWRLSCLHPAQACDIELPPPARAAKRHLHVAAKAAGDLALAVDLGTTSISWAALENTAIVAEGGELNPQIGLGGEVLSRLALAAQPGGLDLLQGLALDRLAQIRRSLEQETGRSVERVGVAANPAMTAILCGLDAPGLRGAPYRLDYAGGEDRTISQDLPPVRIPPMLAPFVGGDLSAGLAALHCANQAPPDTPYLLADLGTNGELVLALSENEFLLASVPMGPALEGVGLSCGRTAGPGTAVSFRLSPFGPEPQFLDQPPGPGEAGMTGTGAISLAALLLRNQVLSRQGTFQVRRDSPLGDRLADLVVREQGESRLRLNLGTGGELSLTAADLEELLKVKAAFHVALDRLLAEAGLSPGDLQSVQLAGALGEHVNTADLETLGFLPPGLGAKVNKVGNSSLTGMKLLLADSEAWAWVLALPGRCRVLDLAADPGFQAEYVNRMRFSHD